MQNRGEPTEGTVTDNQGVIPPVDELVETDRKNGNLVIVAKNPEMRERFGPQDVRRLIADITEVAKQSPQNLVIDLRMFPTVASEINDVMRALDRILHVHDRKAGTPESGENQAGCPVTFILTEQAQKMFSLFGYNDYYDVQVQSGECPFSPHSTNNMADMWAEKANGRDRERESQAAALRAANKKSLQQLVGDGS
ncbi:MAG: hypothetical protein V1926_02335 [Candidatus Peregrinibacteria bacterium]